MRNWWITLGSRNKYSHHVIRSLKKLTQEERELLHLVEYGKHMPYYIDIEEYE